MHLEINSTGIRKLEVLRMSVMGTTQGFEGSRVSEFDPFTELCSVYSLHFLYHRKPLAVHYSSRNCRKCYCKCTFNFVSTALNWVATRMSTALNWVATQISHSHQNGFKSYLAHIPELSSQNPNWVRPSLMIQGVDGPIYF